HLDERLALVRHAGGRAAHDPPHEADAHEAEQDRHRDGIQMQGPEAAVAEERPRVMGQVVTDVGGGIEFFAGGHQVLGWLCSRTKNAIEKITAVTTNDPRNAGTTTSA